MWFRNRSGIAAVREFAVILDRLNKLERQLMDFTAAIAALTAVQAELTTSVQALVAKGSGVTPPDANTQIANLAAGLQTVADQLKAAVGA